MTTYAPFGFRPARLFNASAPNYALNARNIAYNYGSQIAMFDPVFLNTSGNAALFVKGGTTIDGIAVDGTGGVIGAIRGHQPGDTVHVTVERNGKDLTVDVTLAARPKSG